MRSPPIPLSGPITLDFREHTPMRALHAVEDVVRRMRPGARKLVLRVSGPDVIDATTRWARVFRAPHEVVSDAHGTSVCVYLLPSDFGGHPATMIAPAYAAPRSPMGDAAASALQDAQA